jgi:hypothetical protein
MRRDPPPQFTAPVEDPVRNANERRATTENTFPAIPGQGHWQFLLLRLDVREQIVLALR